jgi:hypothetical protein
MTDPLERYARFFEHLGAETLDDLAPLLHRDVRFKDPFNDVRGARSMIGVLAMMYDHGTPRFIIRDRARGHGAGYLRWRYESRPKGAGATWVIEGMSEVRFDDSGLVIEHVDHWDAAAQFYSRLPLVGWLIKRVAKRLEWRGERAVPPAPTR